MLTARSRTTRTGVCALTAAALALAAGPAAAQQAAPPNPREVPNAACGQDTPQAGFPDRDAASATHRRSIDCVAARGIAEGRDGRYLPADTVDRAQMASFVARTLETAGHQLPPPEEQGFQDIEDSVHRDRIRQLAAAGIVQGRTADRYDPAGLVSRDQMAAYLVRAASWAHDHEYQPRGDDPYFLDISSSVHADDIRAGYELYLFEGTSAGQYDPARSVRRDAMATFLTRALDLVHTGERQSTHQTYLVAPQEPVEGAAPGEQVQFEVLGRYDDVASSVGQSLHLALFPCAAVGTDTLPATFTDADGDGLADGIGMTNTQLAHIDSVNGQPTSGEPTLVPTVAPQDGTITFTVVSPAADCTVAVAFDDRAPTDQLRVDATGLAANPYGIGVASWR